jgi:hypothetical protein
MYIIAETFYCDTSPEILIRWLRDNADLDPVKDEWMLHLYSVYGGRRQNPDTVVVTGDVGTFTIRPINPVRNRIEVEAHFAKRPPESDSFPELDKFALLLNKIGEAWPETGLRQRTKSAQQVDSWAERPGPRTDPLYDDSYEMLKGDSKFREVTQANQLSMLQSYESTFEEYLNQRENLGKKVPYNDVSYTRQKFYKAMERRWSKEHGK